MKSAQCIVCNKIFMPKWHGRNKVCSEECKKIIISKKKQKYTSDQIDQVISLKKNNITNSKIKESTGVKLSKIKEIVKEHNLYLTQEQKQTNAYQAKMGKNPNAIKDMRSAYQILARSEKSLEDTKVFLLDNGYEYVSGFKSKSKPFTVRCIKCKKTKKTSKINTIVKDSCMHCSGCRRTSKTEEEIKKWIDSLGIGNKKFKFKKRKDGLEIDIFIPSFKLGIEYCGLYWHNENSPTPRFKSYHYNKMLKANQEEMRLITIFEDEWRDRKAQIKNFIKSILNINENRVFARKCECKIINNKDANLFLEETHIQGAGKTVVAFGLFYNNTLIGVMTGSHHHRGKNDNTNTLVLNRLSFRDGWQIVGGSSKLLKNLINYAKSNNHTKIISWSDNRWSEGRVYEKMGFVLEETLGPDYSYVCGPNRISKQSCQRKDLIKKGGIGNTELEMANSLKYYRIWDCGKKRWILKLI